MVYNDDFYYEVGRNEYFKQQDDAPDRELVDLRIADDKYVFDYGDPVPPFFFFFFFC